MIGDGFFFLNFLIHSTQEPQDTYLSAKWPRLHGIPVQNHFAPAFFAKARLIIIISRTASADFHKYPVAE